MTRHLQLRVARFGKFKMLRKRADSLCAWARIASDRLAKRGGRRQRWDMKGVDDYINTVLSPGRAMMTICCLPTRPPSGLLVYAGLRYTQRETLTEADGPGDKGRTLVAPAECGST